MQLFAQVIFIGLACIFAVAHASHHANLHKDQTIMSGARSSLNVLKQQLAFFSDKPMTGFMRNGYCDVPAGDFGNHAVAGMTLPFPRLDYCRLTPTGSRGDGGVSGLYGVARQRPAHGGLEGRVQVVPVREPVARGV